MIGRLSQETVESASSWSTSIYCYNVNTNVQNNTWTRPCVYALTISEQ